MRPNFKDRLHFTKTSLSKNAGPLLMMLVFMLLGAVVIYIGFKNSITFLWVLGTVFAGIPLLMFIFTIPSSFLYYYEQAQTKKHGAYTTASIIEREEKDVSYFTRKSNEQLKTEEFQYFLSYSYEYNNSSYKNTFLVTSKNCFDELPIGKEIPIQFLRTNPKKSSVRKKKLANELGLALKDCK